MEITKSKIYNIKVLTHNKGHQTQFSVGLKKGFINCISWRDSVANEALKAMNGDWVNVAGEIEVTEFNGIKRAQLVVWGLQVFPNKLARKEMTPDEYTAAKSAARGSYKKAQEYVKNTSPQAPAPKADDLDWMDGIEEDLPAPLPIDQTPITAQAPTPIDNEALPNEEFWDKMEELDNKMEEFKKTNEKNPE